MASPDLAIFGVGGADKNAVVFQKDTEQIVATLKGHTKKVTGVVYHPKQVNNNKTTTNNFLFSLGYCDYLISGYDSASLGGGVCQLSADYQGELLVLP